MAVELWWTEHDDYGMATMVGGFVVGDRDGDGYGVDDGVGDVRKICTIELLSHVKINSFKSMRKEELDLLIASIKEAACSRGTAVDLSAKVACLTSDMTYRMLFGKKCTDREVNERRSKAAMREGTALAESPNLARLLRLIFSGLRRG
ncbi:hypothetical protein LWI29_037945 [Acer saccharum]|uniref:Uncharacterized protein n=1 Tax=Acer saccharum TaxID=4024 RepID=A0AA39TIZ9_ACESA|nr:hypothetical protein LWI29_037945 [Acer saccharum]